MERGRWGSGYSRRGGRPGRGRGRQDRRGSRSFSTGREYDPGDRRSRESSHRPLVTTTSDRGRSDRRGSGNFFAGREHDAGDRGGRESSHRPLVTSNVPCASNRGRQDRRESGNVLAGKELGAGDRGTRESSHTPWVTRPIGYKRLEIMVNDESPKDIIVQLASSRTGLEERLRGDGDELRAGMTQMLLKVFAKMSDYDGSLNESLIRVLELIMKYNFLLNIVDFIYAKFAGVNSGRRQELSHIINALKVMNMLLNVIPKTSEKKVSMNFLVLNSVVVSLGGAGKEASEYIQQVKERLEMLKEKQKAKKERKMERTTADDLHSQPPPGDFREIPVFPQMNEIQGTTKPFIRTNLIDRGYLNIDHYLDVQYRLLREDFIRPLREGIQEIMFYGDSDRKGPQRFQNVKVYQDVRIEFMKPDSRGMVHAIQFSTENLQKVRWRNTKRLLYGNLLCLSSDQFKNDILFAVVADRKLEDLAQGFLTVQFVREEGEDDDGSEEEEEAVLGDAFGAARPILRRRRNRHDDVDMSKTYTMVETDAYFEAYRHVLAGLKDTKKIPLERYIVSCATDMQAPQYLKRSVAQRVSYDFSPITKTGRQVDVLHCDWPSPEELGLDQSQSEALKLALTSELAIIQGPPGTGKTYVGLIIMKILLKNKLRWATPRGGGRQHCAILVVCYTNHALDQFLEEIAKFSGTNQTIVRVGGRCNNEVTKAFSLNEIRKQRRANKVPGDENAKTRRAMWEIRSDLKVLEQDLQANTNILEASRRIIQNFSELERFIPKNLSEKFYAGVGGARQAGADTANEILLSWLGLRGGGEEPDFAQVAQNFSKQHRAVLHSEEDIGRAYHATGTEEVMLLHTWFARWKQAASVGGYHQGVNDDGDDAGKEEDDDVIMEEADLVQQGMMLDTGEFDFKTVDKNVLENRKEVQQLRKNMAALTFEDIIGHTADKQNNGWQQTSWDKKKTKQNMKRELGKTTTMTATEERRVVDIHALTTEQKWKLYRTWVSRWREQFRVASGKHIEKYNKLSRQLQELRKQEDAEIIRGANVVAITTTGAAKYRDLIYEMNCKIVVVEEAAEVLEAHIITAMPLSTKHLILIGDHQQLKPSPTVYKLAKDYNLDTSLFERLMGNIPHVALSLQHRMRPEIANLLRPNIYANLLDHESVLGRAEITGVEKSMFFLKHNVPEESVSDGRSKQNQYEADFLIALCKYLIMQGYKTGQITILAMYTGQLLAFRNKMREQICKGVRVTAVDNFQGEENDIVLLSLVRSNSEAKIGFLGIDNRICVALSRAKNALYCIGDMNLLACKSPMWRKIVVHLYEKEAIGETLALQCKNHPDKITPVNHAKDFSKVPEGGCGQPCETHLSCGHVCHRSCHPDDHSKTDCEEKCGKELPCGHRCKRKCYQECGNCTEKVTKVLPECGHVQCVACYITDNQIQCTEKMPTKLSCGHTVDLPCHQTKSKSRSLCKEKCQDLLDCEHSCGGTCNDCFQGRLHVPCRMKCRRTLVCGHECKSYCSQCPPCEEMCKTKCIHGKCEKRCGKPCVLCRKPCAWKCVHYQCTKLCSEPCNRPPCNKPCLKKIEKCSHPCIGLCGEPCPKLCRICHKESFLGFDDKADARFVQLEDCGHLFTYQSLDRWMEQEEDGNEIKMKQCPRCKTLIWRNTRYGKIINKLLNKVNKVKDKMWGNDTRFHLNRMQLTMDITGEEKNFKDTFRAEINRIKDQVKEAKTPNVLFLLEEKFRRFQKLSELTQAQRKLSLSASVSQDFLRGANRDLECVIRWVLLPRGQIAESKAPENESFCRETARIKDVLKFIDIEAKSNNISQTNKLRIQTDMQDLKRLLLMSVAPYTDSRKSEVEQIFEFIFILVPELSSNLGISNEEKQMICKAMCFAAKGHWYSCSKGHIYAIGDCRSAITTARCPECRAEIGGTGQSGLRTNPVATEMDSATRPVIRE